MNIPIGILEQVAAGGGATGAVVSVEKVTGTITGTSLSINLTKSQDETKCVPFVTKRHTFNGSNDSIDWIMLSANMYDNSGTPAVNFIRGNTDANVVIVCYVVEFNSDISIQKIFHSSSTGSATSWTASVTAVDLSKTFLVNTARCTASTSADDANDWAVRAKFNSTTQLGFTREASPSNTIDGYCYVIEDTASHFTVQTINTVETTIGNQDQTITSVDTTATMLVSTFSTTNPNTNILNNAWSIQLLNSTTVRIKIMVSSSYTRSITAFVVEWEDGTSVQRGYHTSTGTDLEQVTTYNKTLSAVDLDAALPNPTVRIPPGYPAATLGFNAYQHTAVSFTFELTSTTNLALKHYDGTTNSIEMAWEVVEFEMA